MSSRTTQAILLINLGSPDAPTAPAIARYLAEFLGDRRVVDIPKWLWYPILHGIILRRRPARLVPLYEMIWNHDVAPENGAPLKAITLAQASALQQHLDAQYGAQAFKVYWAMRYQNPAIGAVLQRIADEGLQDIIVLPLYPQYSMTTTETVFDEIDRQIRARGLTLQQRRITEYPTHPQYIQALVQSIQAYWQTHGTPNFAAGDRVLLSFHGLPERNVRLGDPYQTQCNATHRALTETLHDTLGVPPSAVHMAYQSRFGAQKWLQPYAIEALTQLAQSGTRRVDVLCPGFSADCLETLEEVAHQLKAVFLDAGGEQYHYIPCLNTDSAHIEMMAQLTQVASSNPAIKPQLNQKQP